MAELPLHIRLVTDDRDLQRKLSQAEKQKITVPVTGAGGPPGAGPAPAAEGGARGPLALLRQMRLPGMDALEGTAQKMKDALGGGAGGGGPLAGMMGLAGGGGAGAAGAGGGAGMAGGAGAIGAAVGAAMMAVEFLKKIFGFVMSLEPMRAVTEMIGTIMKLFFMPLALMLFTLLRPILVTLIKMMPLWLQFWRNPLKYIDRIPELLQRYIDRYLPAITRYLTTLASSLFTVLIKVLPQLVAALTAALYVTLTELARVYTDWVLGGLRGLGEDIWDALAGLGDTIWGFLEGLGGTIGDAVRGAGEWLWGQLQQGWNALTSLGGQITSKLQDVITSLGNKLSALPQLIRDKLQGLFAGIKNAVQNVIGTILGLVTMLPQQIGKFVGQAFSAVMSYVESLPRNIWGMINPFDDFIITDSGRIIRPNPNDTIIGTRDPQRLLGGATRQITNNITVHGVMSDSLIMDTLNRINRMSQRGV